MKQVQYILPDSWCWKLLNDISEKITDGTHHSPKVQHSEWKPGRFKYVTSKNIKNGGMKLDDISYIDEDVHNEIYARCAPEFKDQLLTKDGAMTGTCCLNELEEPFSLLSSVALIKQKRSIVAPKYLNYYLQSHVGQNFLLGDISGAAITRTNIKKLKSTPVPLAPLREQKRIVEKLDALLTRIDTAIEHLQESVELGGGLFKSTMSSLICDESAGWERLSLEELGRFSGGGTPSKSKSEYWNGDVLWVTPKDMKSPIITDAELKITSRGVIESSAKYIPARSILIVARSGILRHTLPVCLNETECTVNQDIKVFIPGDRITPEYVQYMLKGFEPFILSELVKGGVTVESLKYKEFQSYRFPIPSLVEQKQIVERLTVLSQAVEPARKQLCQKIEHLKQLKSSILDSAFKGEL